MSQDLKGAIEWARDMIEKWRVGAYANPTMVRSYTLLADAAQKWLDAQPKPVWIVYAWLSPPTMRRRYETNSLQEAKDVIDAAIMEGCVKFELLPPSAT